MENEDTKFAQWVKQADTLGLEGPEKQKYIQQCMDREDRARARELEERKAEREAAEKEKQAARELEEKRVARELEEKRVARELEEKQAERAEKQAERELAEKQAERELAEKQAEREYELQKMREEREFLLRQKEIEQSKIEESQAERVPSSTQKGPTHVPKLPLFREDKDDIDSFFYRFETHARICKWDEESWTTYFAASLQGQALSFYHSLCTAGPVAYADLKLQFLRKFQCTEDGFRERFRSVRPEAGESFFSFCTRIRHLLARWIELSEIEKSFEGFQELILREQFLHSCSKDLAVFLRERKLRKLDEICSAAENYRDAHPEKNLARKGEPSVYHTAIAVAQQQRGTSSQGLQASQNRNFSESLRPQYSGRGGGKGWGPSAPQPVPAYRPAAPQHDRSYRNFRRGAQYQRRYPPRNMQASNASGGAFQQPSMGTPKPTDVCRKCGGMGHWKNSCPSVGLPQTALACRVLSSLAVEESRESLPIFPGTIAGRKVTVLRDTGCTTAGVRRALVSPDQFTGRTQRCISFGGKVEVFPLARVNVDTPFYSGILECCVIDRPVADLIIGNLPGVVDDVLKSASCTAVRSSLLEETECIDVVSQGDEVSLDGECVTAHEKSLAAPEHPVSTPHSSCSEPTPSPETLMTGDVSVVSVCHDDMIPAEIENGGAISQLFDSVLSDVVTDYKGCADSGHSSAFSAPDSAVSASSTDPVQAALVTTRLQARKEKAEVKPLATAFPPELNVTRDDLGRLQREDAALKPLFARVGQVEENRVSFVISDGILYRHFAGDEEVVKQIVVPGPLRSAVLCAAHDGIMAGHCGVRRTLRRVLLRFYWPGVRCAVKDYCQTCDICQKTIPKGRVAPVPLQQMPVVDVPFKRIAVDLVGPISPCSDRGHRYILTVVDVATRFPEAVPLKNIDTVSVAEALVTLFSRVGCPDEILSDCGTQFISDLMKEIYRLLSVKSIHTSPYHPQSNGQVERFNGVLKTMLRKVVAGHPRDWDRYIPALLFAYRELPNESTGFSPFELLFGRRPRGPMDILAKVWSGDADVEDAKPLYQYVSDLKTTLSDSLSLAQDNIRSAASRHKLYFDRKATSRSFKVNDEVLVLLPTDSNKLLMAWKGPYKVLAIHGVDYKISVGGKEKVLHANMLKRYSRRSDSQPHSATLAVTQGAYSCTEPDATAITDCPDLPFQNEQDITPDPEVCLSSCFLLGESDPAPVTAAVAAFGIVTEEEFDDLGDDMFHSGTDSIPTLPASEGETIDQIRYDDALGLPQRSQLRQLFELYEDILTDQPGCFQGDLVHSIRLVSPDPIRIRPYPFPFSTKATVEEEVHSMLSMGVIEPSDSAYSSPVVLVRKKDGSVRFCIDFRALNKITEFDSEPIPDTEELFAQLAGANFFTKIDLSKGYFQMVLNPADRHKTAFPTPLGLMQWVRMPFGLVTAPATFARMMRLLHLEQHSALNFFDDILVKSECWQMHLHHVKGVLSALRANGLTARPSKLQAGFRKLEFLGHVVGEGRLQPEPAKVKKILEVATPRTRRQVRSLLGLLSYYRRYVPNFASLVAPLSDLTKGKDRTSFSWSPECARALVAIQSILSSSPVLLLPRLGNIFIVRTDASGKGLGGVLLQELDDQLHPVSFVSRKLLDRETRYSTIERECLAIVWVLSKFSRYLWGVEFTLQTDHKPLTYLHTSSFKNSRLMRWALSLQEFRFQVEPLPGSKNVLADLLSRADSNQVVPHGAC